MKESSTSTEIHNVFKMKAEQRTEFIKSLLKFPDDFEKGEILNTIIVIQKPDGGYNITIYEYNPKLVLRVAKHLIESMENNLDFVKKDDESYR